MPTWPSWWAWEIELTHLRLMLEQATSFKMMWSMVAS